MSWRSTVLVIVVGVCILVGIGGCDWKEETGFVEIRRSGVLNLGGDDQLVFNSTEIANLAQKDHMIIQEPVGAASIQIKRGDKSQKLCDLEVKKNRVVTVTLTSVNTIIRCSVQT
jgi:hypothetical protein